jgi:aminopeptidase N
VPEGKVAVANGLPAREPRTDDGWTTWYWDAPDLQASYLTTASVGDFEIRPVELSGQDLSVFFDIWLRRPEKPVDW